MVWVLLVLAQSASGSPSEENTGEGARSCAPLVRLAEPIPPRDTYLQPVDIVDGMPIYVHVTEADMPWRIAVRRPPEAPRYGSANDARMAVIDAIRLWEEAIRPYLPWFRLEFVERDAEAPVQIVWKRRVAGPWSAFGGPRYAIEGGCIRIGGRMELSIRPSVESHMSVDDIHQTAAHEFGHVLGLKHCLRCDSMMNYQNRAPQITELDVRTFRRLVAIPNGAHVVGRPGRDPASTR